MRDRMHPLMVLLALLPAACTSPPPPPPPGPGPAAEPPLRVGFLMLDGVYNSELMAPFDVFQHTIYHVQPGMEVFTVGRTLDPVTSFEGLRLLPDHDLDSAPAMDVLVVPSAEHNLDSDLEDRRLIEWVAARARAAKHVISVCDGAFLLAEAGVLDGHRCTTFPADIPLFRTRYPDLAVVEGSSFVADGSFITGVGGARSYDPAMYLVEVLYGKSVAEGVGRGLVIDWSLERVPHVVASGGQGEGRPRCFLPGETLDPSVTVEDAEGRPVALRDLVQPGDRALVLCLMAGAEDRDEKKRGGFWCEDTFNDQPLWRHLILKYQEQGVRFVAVACPPVYHGQFGFDRESFLNRAPEDPVYLDNRERFVAATRGLIERDALPFPEVYYDPHFRLLANPSRGEPGEATGPRPDWQGRFKWYQDTQTYGTPTTWVLTPDLEVVGAPFFMNVYESPGRKLRYTVRDVTSRLDRLLRETAVEEG